MRMSLSSRHVTHSLLVLLFVLLAGCGQQRSPSDSGFSALSAAGPLLEPTRIGNVFFDDETPTIKVNGNGHSLDWELRDVRGVVVLAGKASSARTNLELRLPEGERGFYTLKVSVLRGNQVVSSGLTTLAVLERHDFTGEDHNESIFAAQTHFGQFVEPPEYHPESDRYSAGVVKNHPEVAELLAAAGVRTVRDELPWSRVEPERGLFVFPNEYLAYMEALRAHDISSLTILNYGNKLYDVDEEGVGAIPFTDAGRQAYANYGAALVDSFPGQIAGVELWNEINALARWNRGPCRNDGPPRPDPEHVDCYIAMLEATSETVKAADSSVAVTGPAAVTLPYGYLEMLFRRGGLPFLDAITVHPYGYPAAPEFGYGNPAFIGTSLEDRARQLRNLIHKYNNGEDKPIYFSEIGWPTGDATRTVSELGQAKYLARAYVLSLAAGVDKVFWYDFVNDGIEDDKREQNFGIVHAKEDPLGAYVPKPAYVAFAVAARELSGASLLGKDDAPEGVNSYIFESNGNEQRVMWVPADTDVNKDRQTVTIATESELTVTTMVGKTRTYQPVDGEVFLTLSGEPVYVKGDVESISAGARISLEPGRSGSPLVLRVDNSTGQRPLHAIFGLEGETANFPVLARAGEVASRPVKLSGDHGLHTVFADVVVSGRLVASLERDVYVVEPGTLPFPDDIHYGDSFPYPGSRGESLQGDPPEIDNTGLSVSYRGFAPAQFAVSEAAVANAVNDGGSGALRLAPPANADVTLMLPVPERRFSAEVQLVPFTGTGSSARNLGLYLTSTPDNNFFQAGVSVRFGIGMSGNGVLRSQQRGGQMFTIPVTDLEDYAAGNWNALRLEVDLDANTVGVMFNGQLVETYTFVNLDRVTHVGLEAHPGNSTEVAYLDNFSVSPIADDSP